MKYYSFFSLFLFIFLFVLPVYADQKIIGHMDPIENELLNTPIELKCGIIIREKRGGQAINETVLNKMCTEVSTNFPIFLKKKGYNIKIDKSFSWNMSFLPEASCYRCLNDLNYRFVERQAQFNVVGYTEKPLKYTFLLSNSKDKEFNVTFVHELFHAMSMFYGLYESHSENWGVQANKDEELARDFTEWLGYGR